MGVKLNLDKAYLYQIELVADEFYGFTEARLSNLRITYSLKETKIHYKNSTRFLLLAEINRLNLKIMHFLLNYLSSNSKDFYYFLYKFVIIGINKIIL